MEIFKSFSDEYNTDCLETLKKWLEGLSELRKLDKITQILTSASEADERMADIVHAAWRYLCEQNLWSLRYESLQQYRDLISYRDTVNPILQRFRKSDRTKFSSISTLEQNWGASWPRAIPEGLAPKYWSKHMLSLLAALSKHRSSTEASLLLQECIRQRPPRSRHGQTLMASDVERVLKTIKTTTSRELLTPSTSEISGKYLGKSL